MKVIWDFDKSILEEWWYKTRSSVKKRAELAQHGFREYPWTVAGGKAEYMQAGGEIHRWKFLKVFFQLLQFFQWNMKQNNELKMRMEQKKS